MTLKLEAIGKSFPAVTFTYDERDVMLYALAIGAGRDELDYCYEGRGPKVYPTFAVIPSLPPMLDAALALGADLRTLLHGEQEIALHAPIPPAGTLHTVPRIANVFDKGKGALVVVESKTTDTEGRLLFENSSALFCRGEGGFGGDPGPKAAKLDPPEGQSPDFEVTEATRTDQALLYRLTGDRNPLHADPEFARMAGFERPILHGLCSMGFLGRAVVRNAAGGDAGRVKRMRVRFASVVFPGDTVISSGFRVSDQVYHLTLATGRGNMAITNAMAEIAPAAD